MKISAILYHRYLAIAAVAVLLLSIIMPVLITGHANAGQVTSRFIRITSSKVGQTSVTYNVSFKPNTASSAGVDGSDILGIVVEFCQNSPLLGTSCTKTNGVSTVQTSGSIAVTHSGSPGSPVSFTAQDPTGGAMDGNTLILTHATGLSTVNTANDITFSFVARNPTGTSSTVDNYGAFYARIVTYNTGATSYDSTTPGTHLDDGGVALSTAKQLTVSARVQEQLEFCVAALDGTIDTDGEAPASCSAAGAAGFTFANGSATTSVDLGVVDSGAPSVSPVSSATAGNARNGGVMIRTNAFSGAIISYFAEQDNSSGKLKVPGAACSGASTTDQCFNSAGATQANFQTGAGGAGEKFGLTAGLVLRPTGSTTTNLTRDTDYDGNGTATGTACTAATVDSPSCFAWVDTEPIASVAAEPLATSSTVLDYEMLVLNFAARAAATTPTGSYSVTSTYIATSTF